VQDHPVDVPILAVRGELDPEVVMELHYWIADEFDAGERRLVIDLRSADLLGTPTLSFLCGASRCARRHGATLAVVGLTSDAQEMLSGFALDGVDLHPTLAGALASERGPTLQTSPQ